jgi:hypothetical protein
MRSMYVPQPQPQIRRMAAMNSGPKTGARCA